MFRVNQKVVCVDNEPLPGLFWIGDRPEVGTVYTVIGFAPPIYGVGIVLRLGEIANDVGYAAERFRPVVERKTGISLFKKMLNPAPQKVLEYHRLPALADTVRSA